MTLVSGIQIQCENAASLLQAGAGMPAEVFIPKAGKRTNQHKKEELTVNEENVVILKGENGEDLFPIFCPMCGTWIASLIPECLPGYLRFRCPNGHRAIFPKGIHPDGTTEVIAG